MIINESGYPTKICRDCLATLQLLRNFKETCIENDERLKEIHIKKLLQPIPSPPSPLSLPSTSKFDQIKILTVEELNEKTEIEQIICDDVIKDDIDDRVSSEDENPLTIIKVKKNFPIRKKARKIFLSSKKYMNKSSRCRLKKLAIQREKEEKRRKERENMVPCHLCGKFYSKFHLQGHLNSHNGLKPFACPEEGCDKAFTSVVLQRRHYRVCHTDYAPYICDICGKKCKNKPKLTEHKTRHFEPTVPCPVCGKLFKNKRAIIKHNLVHSGERPHKCETCGKSFQTKYTLRVHTRIHTNEKPYKCLICEKSFAYNCLLKAHSKKCNVE